MDFNWVFGVFEQSKSSEKNDVKTSSLKSNSIGTHNDLSGLDLASSRAAFYIEGDWLKTLEICSQIIDKSKPEFGDYIVRANTYLKLNKYLLAIEDCSTAIKINPKSSSAYCTRAFAYRSIGKLNESEADCMKALELNPDDPVIYSNRSAVYRARNLWRNVIDDCTEIIKRKETDASAYTMRGAAYGKLRELDTAAADCKKAVELSPNDPTNHANLALVYSMMGKWDNAVHECSQAISLGQVTAGILTPRAIAYGKLRRYDLALADLTHAISLDRSHINAWNNRVIIYTKMGRWADVISDCTLSLEIDPNNLQAYNSRGVAYHMIGNNVLAERDLTYVVEKETNNMVGKGRALGARAAVYCAINKWGLAVEDCQRARVLDPQGSERYKNIQQSARLAAEKAEKDAKDKADMMMEQLIMAEEIEKQKSIDLKEKRKKKKKKKKIIGSRSGSFDALRNMASIDTADISEIDTFDSNDSNDLLGLIELSDDDGESDNEDISSLIKSPPPSNESNSSLAVEIKSPQIDQVSKTLFGLKISEDQKLRNSPAESPLTPIRESKSFESMPIPQVPRSTMASFTPTTPKKHFKPDASKTPASKTPVSTASTPAAGMLTPPPSNAPPSSESTEKASVSIVEMLLHFLPTFPMFNFTEASSPISSNKLSCDNLEENNISSQTENFTPLFREASNQDSIEDYGNYLDIMSDSDSIDSEPLSSNTNKSSSPNRTYSNLSRDSSEEFKSTLTSKRTSSNSLSQFSRINSSNLLNSPIPLGRVNSNRSLSRNRSNSSSGGGGGGGGMVVVPVPKKDDVITVGKLAFSKAHVIGRGSFGTVVYAGAHVEFGRAAIKAISKEGWGRKHRNNENLPDGSGIKDSGSLDDSLNDSFSDATPAEVMAIADRKILLLISQKGTHKSVVRYFGFEEDNNFMYLALELCEVSLWSIFNDKNFSETRQRFESLERQQQFTCQLLEGIKFLHSQQIVHGDLRPKNVLFDYSGQLKIADFGLAQKVSFEDDSFSWQHGGPDGIGGWFAPEVYLKERKTMAVDFFSAGCMIFWVVSNGVHPFGNNPFNVVQGHYQAGVIAGNPEVSDLVGWMISHRFEDRPTIEETLLHPFLWNHETRIRYLTDVGNKIDQYKDKLENVCIACVTTPSQVPLRFVSMAPDAISSINLNRRWECKCLNTENKSSSWREKVPKKLLESLSRRRKYPADSTIWFVRFFRNLDQHFHDQTDEGLLSIKSIWPYADNLSDSDYLNEIRSKSDKQRELISEYIKKEFPAFFLSLWKNLSSIGV